MLHIARVAEYRRIEHYEHRLTMELRDDQSKREKIKPSGVPPLEP
jgi:hypothetical protein